MKRLTMFAFYIVLGCVVLPSGLLCPPVALAKTTTRKDIPEAPLSAVIANAKKVFLLDGQTNSQYLTKNGNALAFDTLYAGMKSWGKYELVDSPKDADIVIELQYRPYSEGSRSYYNAFTKTVQTRDAFGADFALVIYDAKSKEQLWSTTDDCGAARRVSNQQKEVIKSVGRLIDSLKARTAVGSMPGTVTIPTATFWKEGNAIVNADMDLLSVAKEEPIRQLTAGERVKVVGKGDGGYLLIETFDGKAGCAKHGEDVQIDRGVRLG
jgi:hypothetical protein